MVRNHSILALCSKILSALPIYHTFSSSNVFLTQFTTDGKAVDIQIIDGLRLNMEDTASTEPCLADQLEEEAKVESS